MRTLTRVAASAAALALVTGAIELLKGHVPVLSLAVLYLLAIIPVAVAWGLAYGIGTAIGSMLAFNFFFLPPLYTLTLQDSRNWFALLVFLVTAVVVSELATRSRRPCGGGRGRPPGAARGDRRAGAARGGGARGRGAAPERRDEDGGAARGQPRPALAADGDPRPRPARSRTASSRSTAEDRRELAETILGEAERLDRIVRNLLDLSRLQAGAAAPEPGDWPVDDLVLQALDGVEAGGRVEVVAARRRPAARARRSPPGRARRSRTSSRTRCATRRPRSRCASRCAQIGSEVLVRVVDHGPGIPSGRGGADLRAVPARRRARRLPAAPGSGLAIARGFAEANGGRVWVESHAGQGATFVLALPVARSPVEVPA